MYYTGIDLHRKTSFLTPIDENGQIIKKANMESKKGEMNFFKLK